MTHLAKKINFYGMLSQKNTGSLFFFYVIFLILCKKKHVAVVFLWRVSSGGDTNWRRVHVCAQGEPAAQDSSW